MHQRTLWRKAERRYTAIRQQRVWGASDMQCDRVEMPRLRLRERRKAGRAFSHRLRNFPVQVPFTYGGYSSTVKKCRFKLMSEGTISR
jgi:hypothetical protein